MREGERTWRAVTTVSVVAVMRRGVLWRVVRVLSVDVLTCLRADGMTLFLFRRFAECVLACVGILVVGSGHNPHIMGNTTPLHITAVAEWTRSRVKDNTSCADYWAVAVARQCVCVKDRFV